MQLENKLFEIYYISESLSLDYSVVQILLSHTHTLPFCINSFMSRSMRLCLNGDLTLLSLLKDFLRLEENTLFLDSTCRCLYWRWPCIIQSFGFETD